MSCSPDRIFKHGSYYNPANKHYNYQGIVNCDRCYKQNINVCIGYDDFDICMKCANYIDTHSVTSHTQSEPLTFMQSSDYGRNITRMMPFEYGRDALRMKSRDYYASVTKMAPEDYSSHATTNMKSSDYSSFKTQSKMKSKNYKK